MIKIFRITIVIILLLSAACQMGSIGGDQQAELGLENTAIPQAQISSVSDGPKVTQTPQVPESDESDTLLNSPIVDTGQTTCYDASQEIDCPEPGEPFFGQDAQQVGLQPDYQDNQDSTVTDLVTGLMWSGSPDLTGDGAINIDDKLIYSEALAYSADFKLAGYDDWRVPTIKELYSLILFSGVDPNVQQESATANLTPFIDTTAYAFAYGDPQADERPIDAQFATSTLYTSTTMGGAQTMFGVNFADGRIKGYPVDKDFYVLFVRGNEGYGVNDFIENGDGTISDLATGLMWAQDDSGVGMDWESALTWVEAMNDDQYLGYDNWRLPNAKELQSIVDYSRSPNATDSAAINPLFEITPITNESGEPDYPAFWTSTTHVNMSPQPGSTAVYVAFGRAMGNMRGSWMDVHGAGAQRSDPKSGNAADFPQGRGPQGDAIRIENFIRLVRDE